MAPTQNELWEDEQDECLLGNLEPEDEQPPMQDEESGDEPVLPGDAD